MTKIKPSPKQDDPSQSKRFEEMAREVEADEEGKFFKQVLGTVVPPKTGTLPPKKQAPLP